MTRQLAWSETDIGWSPVTFDWDGNEIIETVVPGRILSATGRLTSYTVRGSLTSYRAASQATSLARVGRLGTPLLGVGRLSSYTAHGSLTSYTATGVL